MKSKSKKRLDLVKWRKEVEFVNYWPSNSKPKEYNALIDKHNLYYFQLPSIQKHLKKLKKKAKKQQTTTENQALIQGLERNRTIFGPENMKKSISVKGIERTESSMLNRRNAHSSRSISTSRPVRIAQQIHRFSLQKRLPPIHSRRPSPHRVRTQRQSSIQRYNVMQQIIRRRLGTTFE